LPSYRIDGDEKRFEEWNVIVTELCKVVGMDIGGVIGMSDFLTTSGELGDDGLDGFEKVDRHKIDAWILPVVLERASRRHHNFGPLFLGLTDKMLDNGIAADAIATSHKGDLGSPGRHDGMLKRKNEIVENIATDSRWR
jgi:hypothetical protein